MKARFKDVKLLKRAFPHEHHRFQLDLRPLPRKSDFRLIAANLVAGDTILIHPDGGIEPTNYSRKRLAVVGSRRLFTRFRVDITVRAAPALPFAHCVQPDVTAYKDRGVEHFLIGPGFEHPDAPRDDQKPMAAMCYVAPHQISWTGGNDPIVELVDDMVTWLACFAFTAYGGTEWLVKSAPHDARTILRTVGPGDPCPLYCGKPFGDCGHRDELSDQLRLGLVPAEDRAQGTLRPRP